MTKSVYEVWFSWPNGTKSRLPVLPTTIEITSGTKNESVDIAGLGEVTILQEPSAKVISFSSFFPARMSPLVEYPNPSKPWAFIERFELFKDSKKPVRIIITGTPINMAVSIEDFNYHEEGGVVGDINYTVTLKEYRFVSPRKINTKKNTNSGDQKRPDTKPIPKTYKVKKGDTLTGIAKTIYKNSAEWKTIWEANKQMFVRRDKRNVKHPGRYIYPGQVLTIPQKQIVTGVTAANPKIVQEGIVSVSLRK
ncbi:LysM peptidoglycan-binding domain-containing protein [Pseudobacillus wudalianchiensis]|uniref:Phage portal protein n=1 Tax=Pseudobacillus wudalianchiensis TaxID=1743143 RepID=A0A1B9AMS9_9BACI|nr:LysM peptidoglycan-binding domain-containing protein [Bacillus wudalianchiensis]OCA85224.1 phage portal protein [Bacillus wudalianchiensis]